MALAPWNGPTFYFDGFPAEHGDPPPDTAGRRRLAARTNGQYPQLSGDGTHTVLLLSPAMAAAKRSESSGREVREAEPGKRPGAPATAMGWDVSDKTVDHYGPGNAHAAGTWWGEGP